MSNIKKLEYINGSNTKTPFTAEIKPLTHNQAVHRHNFFEIKYILAGDSEYILRLIPARHKNV